MSELKQSEPGLIDRLGKNPAVTNYGPFLLAGFFTLAAGILAWRQGRQAMPYIFWSGALALLSAVTGFSLGRGQDLGAFRKGIIFLGGGAGFLTALLGMALPFLEYSSIFGGGMAEWRKNPGTVLWCAGLLFFGLFLMFLGALLARAFERTSVGMRRLLYGVNAFLTGMLLLSILAVANILAYIPLGKLDFFNRTFDYTASGLYTVSESTQNFLTALKEPVKVYVLLPGNNLITQETETLLETFRSLNKKVKWDSVSRDLNTRELLELQNKYQIPDSLGLLVVYGEGEKPAYDFIKYQDLYSVPQQDFRNPEGGGGGFQFLGEGQLIKTLSYLAEGKSRATVYFTTGNGEFDSEDKKPNSPAGLGAAWDETAKGNYQLEKLILDRNTKKIPPEAEVVVMVGPKFDPPAPAIDALRAYLKGADGKKGKLLLLLDVEVEQAGAKRQMTPMPNLKGLLREFQVEVGDEEIFTPLNERKPSTMTVITDRKSANSIAKAFHRGGATLFLFDRIRAVRALAANLNGPATGGFKVEEILQTDPRLPVWLEADLGANPQAIIAEMIKDEKKVEQKLYKGPAGLGVAVSERGGPDPLSRIPGHEGMAGGEDRPRLVVIGDATWVANESINGRYGESHMSLFASCLSWLRDRPDLGEKPKGQERKEYRFNVGEETVTKLKILPLGLMVLSVIGLGIGVWIIRRR
ncbi:MAG: hypothetical protein EXR99_10080 [Gemmataceae bacterium]|nr:hypothetical protein [Gemmataceae bacterium]